MPEIITQRHINSTPENVFAQATNLQDAPWVIRSIERLEVLTAGPVGLGTRYRETRSLFGRRGTEEMEITHFEPPHRYTVETQRHGNRWQSHFDFHAHSDGGTEARITFQIDPLSRGGKWLGGAMMPLMRRQLTRALEDDLGDLKRAAES